MVENVTYKKVNPPKSDNGGDIVPLTDYTIKERLEKTRSIMKEKGFSSLIIYADKEHGSNFEYFIGLIPRFEEALLVINQDGDNAVIFGNENYNKVPYARIGKYGLVGLKSSLFSLPNQPMDEVDTLPGVLSKANIDDSGKVGLVGWKMMPGDEKTSDIPYFIVDAIKDVISEEKLYNATGILISPEYGARVTNNANEIARYEYWASLASDSILEGLDALKVGANEQVVGEILNKHGQYNNIVTITSFGERFQGANLYPRNKNLEYGDKVALTVGFKCGLSNRAGYAVENYEDLEKIDPGYLDNVVLPYFKAYVNWFEMLKIGREGGDFYEEFKKMYPQEVYGWELCPGHLTADEEWLSSPFYEGSKAKIQSGMLFQVDFIPSQEGHHGVSAESTIAVADEELRNDIKEGYPKLWERIQKRRNYLKEELNINLDEHILPMASTLAYYRPFMLNENIALVVDK